ncbi:hypothetical protein OWR29_42030 [Actinoplanes sp. Pm04-4]|uniref:Uncharacterized protein n=1 Tax=Paractinoplanes pyxinae TaxID=2997416 RepID=A0ABT4BDM2_9ACTN|nr:hypothetical protein [Actinoplanes pyxinae]MCY1144618.1 hypothetical protein [Actinoplanes pyxinae]
MKFFSNEKETEVEPQADPDRTQPVSSGPVTVPPQRAGSPWSDAPSAPDGSRPADDTATRSDDVFRPEDPSRTDDDVDASRPDDASRPADASVADRDLRDGTTDKAATTTTYGPDGSVVEDSDYRATQTGAQRDDSPVDLPLTDDDDKTGPAAVKDDGTFDSPRAVDPATGKTLDDTDRDRADADRDRADSSDRLDGSDRLDSEDFQRASDTPVASPADSRADSPVDSPVAEAAAVPVAAAPAAASSTTSASSAKASGSGEKLLPDGDSFAERFRDIQLRFVDEPKEATAEAAQLVGDAVDKLTSALKAQRDGLAGNSDDTEKLRVELRAYREILNRLLAL